MMCRAMANPRPVPAEVFGGGKGLKKGIGNTWIDTRAVVFDGDYRAAPLVMTPGTLTLIGPYHSTA